MKRLIPNGVGVVVFIAVLGASVATAAQAEEGFLPLTKKNVTLKGGKVVLETASKELLQCEKLTATGAFENDKRASITLNFSNCSMAGFTVNTLADPKGTLLYVTTALVCLINSEKLLFGLDFELLPGGAHGEVPALGTLYLLAGSVIGHILTSGKAKELTLDLTGKGGKPSVTECRDEKGGVKKGQLLLERNESGKVEELSINSEPNTLAFEEAVELMDK
jgi:hypothetical protein